MIVLPPLIDKQDNSNDRILVIIDCLAKMVQYEPIKTTINIVSFVELITNMVME